ncbi:hypothetical protein Asp14428_16630 [Actinoplanes sp. NBRC 14428]|uniref:Uncharacterized protein n=1 Tax=Pseudosporangium ferrugineum TaxID=439699 RepID=A0A2T0SBE4_9ACTN|nr:hypothetical protein [Pseudosporangium ferrugineum]PRY30643.1 hypothetical protein CLV70_104195 [Pseudosporangium ferrugineum]BCJ50188.1 hypothetical protein Asp14428_16630 [Actinoplanes sp. NBRC 14428]
MIAILLGLTAVVLLVAGPTMIVQGLVGRRSVTRELTHQRITFPAGDGLPAGLSRYAGTAVHTGTQARAYADLIGAHVTAATGGRTYSEIADEWLAGGRADDRLARLRETAFMGQSLRGALLGAYQAWQVTVLVLAVGGVFTAMGAAFLALAVGSAGGG